MSIKMYDFLTQSQCFCPMTSQLPRSPPAVPCLSTTHNNSHRIQAMSSSSKAGKTPGTPTTAQRILPKKWRRSKLLTPGGSALTKATPSLWKPKGSCTWETASGKTVTLSGTTLTHLTELERLALQKIAHARLQSLQLGCSVHIPKDGSLKRSKRSAFSLKRKTNSPEGKPGLAFGIPLYKCICNDAELRRGKTPQRKDSLDLSAGPHHIGRKSSCSSVSGFPGSLLGRSLSASPSRVTTPPPVDVVRSFSYNAGAISSDSLSESDSRHGGSSSLLDALSLSSSAAPRGSGATSRASLTPHALQVPHAVQCCFTHLETYGLRTLGIFRIGCSKKRTRQIRDDFDAGREVTLNEEHSAHDVAALLKQYFRDLPDPLLTRDLYNAFVATSKLSDVSVRHSAVHDLIALLPAVNRDTLWALLRFLRRITAHSSDVIDQHGNELPGNKMDAHNVATLFGPNILHKAKGGEFEVETQERADERRDVINVIQDMINAADVLFQVTGEEQDETMRALHNSNPDAADYLLKRFSLAQGAEGDPETSTSSFLEESDSSSAQRSPSYSSDVTDHPVTGIFHEPKTVTSGLGHVITSGVGHVTVGLSHVRKVGTATGRSAVAPVTPLVHVPQFNISAPLESPLGEGDPAWYSPAERASPAPPSPRISPSPKALKPNSDLGVRIAPAVAGGNTPSPGEGRTPARISLRSSRGRSGGAGSRDVTPSRGQHLESSSIPHVCSTSVNQLTVPTPSQRHHGGSESSSSSSYYPSSRSATNSPKTPDTPDSPWSIDPARISSLYFKKQPVTVAHTSSTPITRSLTNMATNMADRPPEVVTPTRTSSTQRPLGVESSRGVMGGLTPGGQDQSYHPLDSAPKWHSERWKHWEKLAKQNSEDFHEQETLV